MFIYNIYNKNKGFRMIFYKLKKGAMFGLDARIALAIFGSLSVISGAALYSAIQNSKVIALVSDLKEIHKAAEQYWLDTGTELGRTHSGSITYDIQQLIDNTANKTNWNGPYIGYEKDLVDTASLLSSRNEKVKMYGRSINDSWGGDTSSGGSVPNACTGASEPCANWLGFFGLDCSFAEAIDIYIDGSLEYTEGALRVYKDGTSCAVYLQGNPTLPTS